MSAFFTGDDWDISVTLKTDGSATDVSGATGIKAAIVSDNSNSPSVILAEVALSAGATGADWANGVVVAEFAAANTASVPPGDYLVEIQVESGGKKKTWPRVAIEVKTGVVT